MDKPRILLTIAARGGSKGVKNKNIRPLGGIPLIAHSIKQAKAWGRAEKIICSTDSPDIAQIAKDYGAEVPFLRPAELATDSAGKLGVLRHALREMRNLQGKEYDILVDLDASAPIRTIKDIEGAYQLFLERKPDSIVTVTPCRKNPYFNMLELGADQYVHLAKKLEGSILRRQDAPLVYDMNASIYVYNAKALLNEAMNSAVTSRTLAWVMDEHSAFDIDTQEDFQFIEYLLEKGIVKL